MPTGKSSHLDWDTSLQYVKGIGPKLSEILRKDQLYTVEDFFLKLPRSYQDNRYVKDFDNIAPDQNIVVVARIVKKTQIPLRSGRKFYEVLITDGSEFLSCKFFRTPYKGWFSSLKINSLVEVRGRVSSYKNKMEFSHPQMFPYEKQEENQETDVLLPIYTDINKLSQNKIRKIMEIISENIKDKSDWMPKWIKEKYKLMDNFESLKKIHFPESQLVESYLNYKTQAQKRFIFNEFFELQFMLFFKRKFDFQHKRAKILVDSQLLKKLYSRLAFELTEDQKQSLEDIFSDLKTGKPMYRMLQGDVGCGKTLVALATSLVCAQKSGQVAFMVPTEILAEQHYAQARKLLEPLGINVHKLTSKMKSSEKQQTLKQIKSGECQICIGTQALIQKGVEFNNLSLVITDEQHRFGAHQRALLTWKGDRPHFLIMTATPIPRTLSLALYGDLDISIIKEFPKGRGQLITKATSYKKRKQVFDFLSEEVKKGRQAYIVYPLIEESESLDLQDATYQYQILSQSYPSIRFAILTGKTKPEEKQKIMQEFRENKINALVSTTVVEVGLDVPNATIMVIENAERFGLSQMHQLRGRVGRGQHKSYCVIVLGPHAQDLAKQRARFMQACKDGFQIAEKDLELRGAGDLLGNRQSGFSHFKMASLIRDVAILAEAKEAVQNLIKKDPFLKNKEHAFLKNKFKTLYHNISPA